MINNLVSIIIPTFNRANLINETLSSIIAQTYTNWECIVVDDGSTDETKNVVNNFIKIDNRIKLYDRPKSRLKGANACRNYGFEKSVGEYIQWFDSDDYMDKDKLKLKVEVLKKNNVDFVVCEGIEFKGEFSNIINKWNKIYSTFDTVFEDHITGKVNFHTNGPLFKRTFLVKDKLFDELLQRKQEWEFFTRLLSRSINFKPIYIPLYYFRSHDNSINGKNSLNTLKSRIKSNQLVYKLVESFFKEEKLAYLNRHFLNKYIFLFKIAVKSKKINLIYFASKALISHLKLKGLLFALFRLLKKPHILKNIFKK
ncbi:glycosyltransferase [Polaribacter sp. Z014]|uniref:glycosyltransferase family 2 protein n=1 Tax=Polaribacter sp. Z014 TaxID=2927126 RepID=UPI002020AC3C|nr:glycosyltransferase family 2 protein [Polaribacter sp. Z014]MCL7764206.1 glycosyltransferase [Polaribacter sp. Z014]